MSYLNFLALILIFLIGIFGLVGNAILIWIFNGDERRSHFNGLTITLAVYDILTILGFFLNAVYSEFILPKLFCLPWNCPSEGDKNEKNECKFHTVFLIPALYVVCIGSILTTVALSLERYLTIHQYRRNVEKVPLKRIILGITGMTVVYNLREFCAELMTINGKIMSEDHTYKLVNCLIHLIFTIVIPYTILIVTNFKVYQTLRILAKQSEQEEIDHDLKISIFKAKFCIFVVMTFIFCHSFKAVGSQGFYGLYSVLHLNKHAIKDVPHWVESIDAFSWLLIVFNSSSTFYVYAWVKRKTNSERKRKITLSTPEAHPLEETQV